MADTTARLLIIGYGNSGRLDDGLGPALVQRVEALDLPGVTTETDYQLNVEHAADLAGYDVVIFADADVSDVEPFRFERIRPAAETLSFSTHSVSPKAVLAMARDMFDATPKAYELGIRGYEFNEFGERLSDNARSNLDAAVTFIAGVVQDGAFRAGILARSTDAGPVSCAGG